MAHSGFGWCSWGLVHLISRDAAEAKMAHAGIEHLGQPCGRAVAQTIVGGTEVRAAFHYLARNSELRLIGVIALLGGGDAGIECRATAFLELVPRGGDKPIGGPFPRMPTNPPQPTEGLQEKYDEA